MPTELRVELTRAAALGNQVWIEARATNDFARFLPALQRNLELKRRYVECFEWEDSPYTPLLDDFEPYMKTSEVTEVFGTIRPVLAELVREAPRRRRLVPRAAVRRRRAGGVLQADPRDARPRGRLVPARSDRASVLHIVLAPGRAHDDALQRDGSRLALVDDARGGPRALRARDRASLERTPLAASPSLGLNESQSRTWENLVGRSRPFWLHWYEPLQETFPAQLGDVDLDTFLAAVNRAEPGLIRVEADETTYSLHIILRFELEQQLIEGSLDPKDLPDAWNAGMVDLLGVEVPDDSHGVLQDIHWSQGGIGYFPTYALGNVISLQIWASVCEAIPDLDAQMEAGELGELAAWLRDNLYSLGRKFTPKETIERLTGTPAIDPQPYLAYLREKLASLPAGV